MLCTFLAQTLYALFKRSPLKCQFWDFWVLGSKLVKFLISILKRQVNSSSSFASFFIVMTYNSSVNFKIMHFLLWMRESHKNPNFEIFQVLWWKCAVFLLSFSNYKSGFLQILHHFLVSWKIIPLEFFRSYLIYFAQKEPVKVKTLRILSHPVKIHQVLVVFETKNQFFSKFCINPQCHET